MVIYQFSKANSLINLSDFGKHLILVCFSLDLSNSLPYFVPVQIQIMLMPLAVSRYKLSETPTILEHFPVTNSGNDCYILFYYNHSNMYLMVTFYFSYWKEIILFSTNLHYLNTQQFNNTIVQYIQGYIKRLYLSTLVHHFKELPLTGYMIISKTNI